MNYGEVKELVAIKLRGDRKDQEVSPLLVKESICDVLRYTRPRSYVEDTLEDSTYFRRISADKHLKMPTIGSIDDNDELPIEEELAMAVVYFLCSYMTNKDRQLYADKAKNICSLYDTNISEIELADDY